MAVGNWHASLETAVGNQSWIDGIVLVETAHEYEGVILAILVLFWPVTRVAAVLLVPYLAWVAFAAVLNYALWRMNS
jgi:tryptophan-rich sensory protein